MSSQYPTSIYVKTQFVGYHRWKNAPEDIKFLRAFHRHVFHVKVTIRVTHSDRDVEFFQFRRKLDAYLKKHWAEKQFDGSCELICHAILDAFPIVGFVDVSEDGENGATAVRLIRDPFRPASKLSKFIAKRGARKS